MLIYVEKKYIDNDITKNIISKYQNSKILEIDNYKNILDKNIFGKSEDSLVIGGINNSISEAPKGYGHPGKGFFFKSSLNCIYDCKYCYLKGAFKNDIPVIFVNYEDIKNQILETIKKERENGNNEIIRFYSSDYSDNLAIDNLTLFIDNFYTFFADLENVKMEIRTKSVNIVNILKYKSSENIEISFSLNPSEIVEKYELKTTSLDLRIKAINKLVNLGFQVGIRFLPLLEVNNYKEIYKNFLEKVVLEIDFKKIYSVFIGGLLYTKKDYNEILNKESYLDILYTLEDSKDGFVREKKEVRDFFYNLFDDFIQEQKCNRCLDN